MKRTLWSVCVVALILVGLPRPAAAANWFWAWLEEWSGPGPFRATAVPVLSTNCLTGPFALNLNLTGQRSPDPASKRCFYVDVGFFHSEPDPVRNFPRINLKVFEFGGSLRVVDGLDIGAGIGAFVFSRDDNGEGKSKLTITPIRLVTRPILLAVPEAKQKKWMALLNVYWKETYVGSVDGTHFGLNKADFQNKGELIRSFGVVIDLTPFLK
jgi:hypothetical protein